MARMRERFALLGVVFGTFTLVSSVMAQANPEAGREINGTCAACHGESGQGGKKGEYPRIGGQNVRYLQDQLRAFRARTRMNIPMFPYTQERELSDEDIRDVSAYLAGIQLSTKMPVFQPDTDALTKLLAMEQVMIVPQAEGDVVAGGLLYEQNCVNCHGKTGKGRSAYPMLVGQYSNYLMRQAESFRKGERPHDEEEKGSGVLNQLSLGDIQNILAYLTSLQEQE